MDPYAAFWTGSFQRKSSAVGYTKAQAEYANLIVWRNLENADDKECFEIEKALDRSWQKHLPSKKPPISERKSILETKTNEPQSTSTYKTTRTKQRWSEIQLKTLLASSWVVDFRLIRAPSESKTLKTKKKYIPDISRSWEERHVRDTITLGYENPWDSIKHKVLSSACKKEIKHFTRLVSWTQTAKTSSYNGILIERNDL